MKCSLCSLGYDWFKGTVLWNFFLERGRLVQTRSLSSHCRLACSCRSATSQPPSLKETGESSCGLHEGEEEKEGGEGGVGGDEMEGG